MKKRLISLFFLLFIPSLIASCDTKIEESKNNDNNSSITKTSVEDSSSTREKDSFPEKSSSSYDISSSVKTEPYGYTIEDGKMTIDVSLNGSSINDNRFPFQIESGNTYDLHELDCLYLTTSINVKNVLSNNESVEIFRNYNSPQIGLYFHDFGTAIITINYENEDYDFFFNIDEVPVEQYKVIPTYMKYGISQYFFLPDCFIQYFDFETGDVIPGNEYTIYYKGELIRTATLISSVTLQGKIISVEETNEGVIESFIVLGGKAYRQSNDGKGDSYPLVNVNPEDKNNPEVAIDIDGNLHLISELPDNTILYGCVNNDMVFGYYTYDINEINPIIVTIPVTRM